jgi:hypothetical protein
MKQCITVEQLKKLRNEDNYNPKDEPHVTIVMISKRFLKLMDLIENERFLEEDIVKQITIGKMIEILETNQQASEKDDFFKVIFDYDEAVGYTINVFHYKKYAIGRVKVLKKETFKSDLTDALWEAVKEVL